MTKKKKPGEHHFPRRRNLPERPITKTVGIVIPDDSFHYNCLPCPLEGQGVNDWVIRTVRRLYQGGMEREKVYKTVSELTNRTDTDVSNREIARAIEKVFDEDSSSPRPISDRPKPLGMDREAIDQIAATGADVAELMDSSPVSPGMPTQEVLEILFPGEPLLCLGLTKKSARVLPYSGWGKPMAQRFSFLVPSPMSAMQGINQSGKPSWRCNDNVAGRRFFVVEIDPPSAPDGVEPSTYYAKEKDRQAAIIDHLDSEVPLACVCDSGNKSLHAFFYVEGLESDELGRFYRLATSLGADRAHWTRCQLARLPNGTRYQDGDRIHQELVYLNPNYGLA
jgi:hypothetical protein